MTALATAPDRTPLDADLLRCAVRGDGDAFARLYERHRGAAIAVARRILGPTPAAEDALQEAMIQLWRQGGRYSPERGSVRAWILVLVRSRALDLLRYEGVRVAATERAIAAVRDTPVAVQCASHDDVARRETARDVRTRIGALPEDQRKVIGLLYLGGRTQAEVAVDLDVPLGTVKGRTRLGLAKLRRELATLETAA